MKKQEKVTFLSSESLPTPLSDSVRFKIGFAHTVGRRDEMEDKILIKGNFRSRSDEDLFAIFDGHAGHEAASILASSFHLVFSEMLNEMEDLDTKNVLKLSSELEITPHAEILDPSQLRVASAIHKAFERTTEKLKNENVSGGTTALVTFFKGTDLYVANVGDTRAVLGKKTGQLERISVDHRLDAGSEERKRIVSSGGTISNFSVPRVEGVLAISRSIGDFDLETKGVIWKPHIRVISGFEKLGRYVIMASDGLWDQVNDAEAVALIHDKLGYKKEAYKPKFRREAKEEKAEEYFMVHSFDEDEDDYPPKASNWTPPGRSSLSSSCGNVGFGAGGVVGGGFGASKGSVQPLSAYPTTLPSTKSSSTTPFSFSTLSNPASSSTSTFSSSMYTHDQAHQAHLSQFPAPLTTLSLGQFSSQPSKKDTKVSSTSSSTSSTSNQRKEYDASEHLVQSAFTKLSSDNISVVVVHFPDEK